MRLRLFALLVSVFSYLPIAAQEYYIDLSKKEFSIAQRNFYISRIIDARANKQSIGFVQRYINNQRVYASFKNGLTKDIQDFMLRNMHQQQNLYPVAMKILKLKITERSNGTTQTATAEVMVDFICEKDGQLLPVFRTSSVQTKNRLDVTAVHDDNISDALVDCLKQFAHINIDERLAKVQAITSEEANKVYEKTEDFLPFAILNDTVIRRGFYKSIDEFRNNTPSFTGDFEIYKRPRTARSWEGEFDVSPYFPTPDGKRRIVKNMWGFSDGQTCYFKYKGEFYALTREGNNFTFYGHRAGSPVGVTVGQAAFGVIGAAVVVSVSNDDIKTKFLFDTQSGRITFYDDYLDAETETIAIAKVVAYYPKAKNQNTTVDFSLANRSDTLSNPLAPNSSVELEWTLDRSDPELSACLNTDTNCLRFVPRMDETTYIEITFDSKSNRFVTEVVNSQKATFYLKKIKSAQEAEARRK